MRIRPALPLTTRRQHGLAVWRRWRPPTSREYKATRLRLQENARRSLPTSQHAAAATGRHRRWRRRPQRQPRRCQRRPHQLPEAPRAASVTSFVANSGSWQRRAASCALATSRGPPSWVAATQVLVSLAACAPRRHDPPPRRLLHRRQGPGAQKSSPRAPPAAQQDDDGRAGRLTARAPTTRCLARLPATRFGAPRLTQKRQHHCFHCRTRARTPLPARSRASTDVRRPTPRPRHCRRHGHKEMPTPWRRHGDP